MEEQVEEGVETTLSEVGGGTDRLLLQDPMSGSTEAVLSEKICQKDLGLQEPQRETEMRGQLPVCFTLIPKRVKTVC